MKISFSIVVLTSFLILSGCSSVPKVSKEIELQAKTFSPEKGKSNLYVYHCNYVGGQAIHYRVSIDKQVVGELSNCTFFMLELLPGKHQIVTNNVANLLTTELSSPIVSLTANAGENYFFETGLIIKHGYMNFSDENGLQLVSEATGREEVSGCDMASIPDSIKNSLAVADRRRLQQAVVQANFPPPSKINSPIPIRGNNGKYMSPFTSSGAVAPWAQGRSEENDYGFKVAEAVAEFAVENAGNRTSKYVPVVGQVLNIATHKAKLEIRRIAEIKKVEAEMLKLADDAKASSDISFNSIDDLAVYLYSKNSTHPDYVRVLSLVQKIYPELEQRYIDAVDKAARSSKNKKS